LGIGVDVGVNEFAVVSNGKFYKNINKTGKVRKLNKRLKHIQRSINRKYRINKMKGVKGATKILTDRYSGYRGYIRE